MTQSIQVTGAAGKTWATVLLLCTFLVGVGTTFTWKVFDSLISQAGTAVKIDDLSSEMDEFKVEIRELIKAGMADRCTGAMCDHLSDRIGGLELLHPRGK